MGLETKSQRLEMAARAMREGAAEEPEELERGTTLKFADIFALAAEEYAAGAPSAIAKAVWAFAKEMAGGKESWDELAKELVG